LVPMLPSDLFIIKQGAPFLNVQGDITQPTVQAMAEGISAGVSEQDVARTPQGIIFIGQTGGVYITDRVTIHNLSTQLNGLNQQSDVVAIGDLDYINEYLFAPNGYVYDFRTKSWFQQTQLAAAFHNVERFTRQIWGPAASGVSFALNTMVPFTTGGSSRMS